MTVALCQVFELAAEEATEIIHEIKSVQEAFRKQKDLHKLEAEVGIKVYHEY